ncbi:DEAD-box ATP-dependent RNA helicase CshA [compost metagenome]
MDDPEIVRLATQAEEVPSEITHHFVRCSHEQRIDALIALLNQEAPERAFIFVRTRHETKRLAQKLDRLAGIQAGYLNGDMSQSARNTMMARFKAGELKFLIATDVAARGIDVEGLSHVFHFAVPTVVETYIHRSGRTGRAGNEGKTITLVTPDSEDDFKAIRKKIHLHELDFDVASLPERPVTPAVPPQPRGRKAEKQQPAQREITGRVPAARMVADEDEWAQEVQIPGLDAPAAAPRGGRGDREPRAERGGGRQRPERQEREPRAERAPRAQARPERELDHAPRAAASEPPSPEGSRRRRGLPPSATNPSRDAASLLSQSPTAVRPSTGPLAPLPRHSVAWKTFKLALAPGHRQTRDSLHEWLSKRTGVARSSMRSIAIHPDHATVEVDERFSERFLQGLKGATAR